MKELRKRGLYNPKNPRKKPTAYAKSILAKFWDVASGKSASVKTTTKVAKQFRNPEAGLNAPRSKGSRVVLPLGRGEKGYFNAKTGDVGTVFKAPFGDKYIRSPFKGRVRSLDDIADQLGPEDRIAVPMFRGKNRGIEWREYTQDEFRAFFYRYGPNGSETDYDGKPRLFQGLTEFIERARFESASAKPHKETIGERRERFNDVTSNVIARQIAKRKARLIAKRKARLI